MAMIECSKVTPSLHKQFEFVVDPLSLTNILIKNFSVLSRATMYMPGTTDFASAIMNKKYRVLRHSYCALKMPVNGGCTAAESNALKLRLR